MPGARARTSQSPHPDVLGRRRMPLDTHDGVVESCRSELAPSSARLPARRAGFRKSPKGRRGGYDLRLRVLMEVCPRRRGKRVGGSRAGRATAMALPPCTIEIITRADPPEQDPRATPAENLSRKSWAKRRINSLASLFSWEKVKRWWKSREPTSDDPGSHESDALLGSEQGAHQDRDVETDGFILVDGREFDGPRDRQSHGESCGGRFGDTEDLGIAESPSHVVDAQELSVKGSTDDFEMLGDEDWTSGASAPTSRPQPVEEGYVWVERKSRLDDRLPPLERALMEARQLARKAEQREPAEDDGFVVIQDSDLY